MKAGWILEEVWSGGQTGVDQTALGVAQDLNYQTGGWAAKHWMTDEGPAPWLGTKYGLREHRLAGYGPRTDQNVHDTDATVLFGDLSSPGCTRTLQAVYRYKKLHLCNPSVSDLQKFILEYEIRRLNCAGNRLRTNPGASATALVVLSSGLLPF